jgi:hypothetical protein
MFNYHLEQAGAYYWVFALDFIKDTRIETLGWGSHSPMPPLWETTISGGIYSFSKSSTCASGLAQNQHNLAVNQVIDEEVLKLEKAYFESKIPQITILMQYQQFKTLKKNLGFSPINNFFEHLLRFGLDQKNLKRNESNSRERKPEEPKYVERKTPVRKIKWKTEDAYG